MDNRRLYSTIGSYLVPTRFLAPMAASKLEPLEYADRRRNNFKTHHVDVAQTVPLVKLMSTNTGRTLHLSLSTSLILFFS
jgi:hypothetical protein